MVNEFVESFHEFVQAAQQWRQWTYLAVTEISMHYRRSILGPFWFTLNMLVLIGALTIVYTFLFNINSEVYTPYVATGLISWYMISSFFNDGANTFMNHSEMIRNVRVPLPFFAFKCVAKQIIVFSHNVCVMLPIYLFVPDKLGIEILLAVPALIVYAINGLALAIILGMLCSRYRDVSQIMNNFLQVCFFITPIFWPAENINRPLIVQGNVFYHYIEIMRAPLSAETPTLLNWTVVGVVTLALAMISFVLFARYRWRIVHTV
ncbi:MAG: hypothetical protein GC191_17095 [Azospirillum sp.]|nr:hypothetical protein [Azospirillum sp.]